MTVRCLTGFLCITVLSLFPITKAEAQVKNDAPSVPLILSDHPDPWGTQDVDSTADLQYLDYCAGNKKDRRRLVHYLKRIAHRDEVHHPFSSAFYYHLANTYARLKLYPQAMKYYYYSNAQLRRTINSQEFHDTGIAGVADPDDSQDEVQHSSLKVPGDLPEISFGNEDTLFTGLEALSARSRPIPGSEIVRPFRNGQPGIAYAVVLLIKQPAAGHRTSFKGLNNVGHTFVTLIKYDQDQTYVSRSFGFYPQKSYPFQGSPLHPRAPATYKDDSKHDWDEVVGKFVTQQQFFRILRSIRQYNRRQYDLNNNNCTDFGLCIAGIAGIQINGTHGTWPLGSGNTPASIGQSVLEGKLFNTDSNDRNGLFISANDSVK